MENLPSNGDKFQSRKWKCAKVVLAITILWAIVFPILICYKPEIPLSFFIVLYLINITLISLYMGFDVFGDILKMLIGKVGTISFVKKDINNGEQK